MADKKTTVHTLGLSGSGGKFSGGYGVSYSAAPSVSAYGQTASPEPAPTLAPALLEQLFERAQAAHQAGQLMVAEPLYLQVLRSDPKHTAALHLLGMLYYQQGKYAQAIERVRQAIAIKPDARYQEHLGAIHMAAGQPQEAEQAYRQAILMAPDSGNAHYNLGVLCQQHQRLDEAETAYRKAHAINPLDEDVVNNLVAVLCSLGRAAAAEPIVQKLVAEQPNAWRAFALLGDVLSRLGRDDDAERALLQSIALDPHQAGPQVLLGCVYWDRKQWDAAAKAFERAAGLAPHSADALVKLAGMRLESDAPELALAPLERALQREPQHVDAHILCADAFVRRGMFEQAQPWVTAAAGLARQRLVDGTPASGSADARFCLGLYLLRIGQFEDGWALNELRYSRQRRAPDAVQLPELPHSIPMWQGEPLAGKVILLVSEQGHGDNIQFFRYATLLKAQGASVWLWVKSPLFGLLQTLQGVDRLLSESEMLPPGSIDYWCFPQSLPYLLGTRLTSIPAAQRYLQSDPAKVAFWKEWLASRSIGGDVVRRRVGLVWSGNPLHANDKNRSIPFSLLEPLLSIPHVQIISLQMGERAGDAASTIAAGKMLDAAAHIHDFADAAALIDQLDLLITVDSAPAHLAGALGRPVWTLLPRVPDWRWLLDRDDSPWYPSMRLFRQPALQDWDSVIAQLLRALAE